MFGELILKQLSILLISAVKFLVAAPTSYLFGYSYLETILNTTVGGWIGVLVFYYLGRYIFSHFPYWRKKVRHFYHRLAGIPLHNRIIMNRKAEERKIFNRRTRLIVRIRSRFGFPGLIILTPVILSIPIGTMLIAKYYSSRKGHLAWLSLSVMAWSVLLSTFLRIF